jgi:UDP-2,4-diacetamido-2,4,6-trideoxy-beta-L-altropyranose hydrolase
MALASVFAECGWKVGFATSAESVQSVAALGLSPYEIAALSGPAADEPEELRQRLPHGTDILVVDHYGRDAAFERACRPWAERVVVIDDLADRPHEADIVVDAGNRGDVYRALVPSSCRVLAGPRYAIVHASFRAARKSSLLRRDGRPVERVLVAFGQVDPPNATMRAIEALAMANFDGHIDVAIGSAAPNLSGLRARVSDRTHLHIDAADMAGLMTGADLAIGAGGSTAWERCCVGLPTILVEIATNQRGIIAAVAAAGAGVDAGGVDGGLVGRMAERVRDLLRRDTARKEMAERGTRYVDGRGASRIFIAAVGPRLLRDGSAVELRPAEADDEAWLLELQQKPATRQFANDPSPPTEEGHRRWFESTLADDCRHLLVVTCNGRRAGMLRFDLGPDAARVSIAVDPDFHRRGVGSAALALAGRAMPGLVLEAEILPKNAASEALFSAGGYRQVSEKLFRRGPL